MHQKVNDWDEVGEVQWVPTPPTRKGRDLLYIRPGVYMYVTTAVAELAKQLITGIWPRLPVWIACRVVVTFTYKMA